MHTKCGVLNIYILTTILYNVFMHPPILCCWSEQEQTHSDRRESIRLKEELQVYKAKAERLGKLQSAMKSQEHKLEDVDAAMKKIAVCVCTYVLCVSE